jgi:Zn-dependent peptidase ImmA (M78 family)
MHLMLSNKRSNLDTIGESLAHQRAEDLISALGIVDPSEINVEDIATMQGALVLEGGLTGAEARLTMSSKINFIRVNSNVRELGRKRFGIAHEIGHLLLHRGQAGIEICSQNDVVLFASSEPKERHANTFAASLLMPQPMFAPRCKAVLPSLADVAKLAQEFEVTLTAAATRYIEFCPHRCCLVVSKNGRIHYHRRTPDFGYFLQPSVELKPLTYAADFYAGKGIPKGMHSVPANAWLEGARIDASKRIMEDSVPMPNYDAVLTLLWIDSDIDRYVTGDDELDAEEEASDSRWSWNRFRSER